MTRRRRTLGDLGEHGWLAGLIRSLESPPRRRRVLVGPGDDAAVLRAGRRPLVLTTDALVEDVHFQWGWWSPRALGRRAFRVAASDVGAMGARPIVTLLAVVAPPSLASDVLRAIARGVDAEGRRHAAPLVGGNLTRGDRVALTVTVVGEVPGRVVRRSGARVGDVVVLSGPVGAAAAALDDARAGRPVRWPAVPDRLGLGVALAAHVRAMIDVSDGLARDLGHLCRAGGVDAEVDLECVPVAARCRRRFGDAAARVAVGGGEDYELLAAVAPRRMARATQVARAHGCRLTPVGRIVEGAGRVVVRAAGRPVRIGAGGFDHFE